MNKSVFKIIEGLIMTPLLWSCETSDSDEEEVLDNAEQSAIAIEFAGRLGMDNLDDYENLSIPDCINKDNTGGNSITKEGATLGRVLFYDKNLSSDNSVSCASCHKQALAFGDNEIASLGVNGTTGRHSMRLANARFSDEENFFWDERAETLEEQTTMPSQDHTEMGFSGTNGDENIDNLIVKLQNIAYYQELFTYAFGDETITEDRMQSALAQFVRSIQSFDSRYDQGRAIVNNNGANFTNFSAQKKKMEKGCLCKDRILITMA